MTRILFLFLLSESAYVAAVRVYLANYHGDPFVVELGRNGLRLISLGVLFWLFRRSSGVFAGIKGTDAPAALAGSVMLLAFFFVGDNQLRAPLNHVFAVTSIIVGLREELAYRGLLQRLLGERLGFWPALATSTFCFTVYHIGVQPFSVFNFFQIAASGLVLGLVYQITQSLILVVLLHAAADAIAAYTPFFSPLLPESLGVIVFGVSLTLLFVIYRLRARPRSPVAFAHRPLAKGRHSIDDTPDDGGSRHG